ncbi:MAG: biotin-dependent carboxyltransferase family protein [Woeseiaceae bacterium]
MSIVIRRAGLQTTIQSAPRRGQRHLGVPLCGPADPLSMALANRLLGNASSAPALEVTLSGLQLEFAEDCSFAVAGAPCDVGLNNKPVNIYKAQRAKAGDRLHVGPALKAVRSYVAVGGGLVGEEFLGSVATYMPAAFGGYQGRALRDNDSLQLLQPDFEFANEQTPPEFRPQFSNAWALRACAQRNFADLTEDDQAALINTNFTVSVRSDRMGLQLLEKSFDLPTSGYLDSDPIFPGCVQCPADGVPYLLSVDAQTTGGYAQLAQVGRVDRHVIGQLRAGDHVRFLLRTPEEAAADLQEKHDYWREWLPDIASLV